jgi:ATP-dependent DNA helicase DinG
MTTTTLTDYTDLDAYTTRGQHPLPSWVTEIRPHQADALAEIDDAYESGAEMVFVDAPTGSGKTLIGELARRRLQARGVYVCSDRSLQQQFVRDFPYARLLQGKANYPTEHGPSDVSCDDCTAASVDDDCDYCTNTCPYQWAKAEALSAELAVLNTSYLLSAANYAGSFKSNEFVIIDEADALEDTLLGFVEYDVPRWVQQRAGLTVPKKGVHKGTLVKWLDQAAETVKADLRRQSTALDPKMARNMASFIGKTTTVMAQLQADIDSDADSDDAGKWIRTYDRDDSLTLKPVLVRGFGTPSLWRHGAQWLLMSATLISTDEMVETLGVPFDTATVTVPMTFPVEHRPIILAPVADMKYSAGDREYLDMAYAIQRACDKHEGDRVLVHCVSRDRVAKLQAAIAQLGGLGRRPIVTYQGGRDRDHALQQYLRRPASVLFAQSMDRGIDLPGDACRVQVIAKVPFPSLGDRRVSARAHGPGGDSWYKVQAIRSIVQMTGRGVRSKDDYATTYIFDAQFTKNLWRPDTRALFPAWWKDAVDKGRDIRDFIRKG